MSSTPPKTNTPLDTAARAKVGAFVALLLPPMALFVGVPGAVILLWGWVMMRRTCDLAYVQTSATIVKVLLSLVILGCIFAAGLNVNEIANADPSSRDAADHRKRHLEYVLVSVGIAMIPLFYWEILNRLFLAPLHQHREWVEQHGVLASKPRTVLSEEVDIIKGEKLRAYSVADELLKWAALKDQGHISDAEFNEARRKLLQRD